MKIRLHVEVNRFQYGAILKMTKGKERLDKYLKDNERLDDLQLKGFKIIQNPEWFCFGIDAVILSDFVKVSRKSRVVEFGTGTGIIPLLIEGKKSPKEILAFEIQKDVADMAKRSVELNNLQEKINIVNDDLNNVLDHVDKASVDVVVSNPPYMPAGVGIVNPHDNKAISRHEIMCTLEDIISNASKILKYRGSLFMVHRPGRLVDIIMLMKKYDIEPKIIRFVHPKSDKKPNIMLIKGTKKGGEELKILDPLVVYNNDGSYTDEIYRIYDSQNIDVFDKRSK